MAISLVYMCDFCCLNEALLPSKLHMPMCGSHATANTPHTSPHAVLYSWSWTPVACLHNSLPYVLQCTSLYRQPLSNPPEVVGSCQIATLPSQQPTSS
jgi:hypothetical protein